MEAVPKVFQIHGKTWLEVLLNNLNRFAFPAEDVIAVQENNYGAAVIFVAGGEFLTHHAYRDVVNSLDTPLAPTVTVKASSDEWGKDA